ncbi:MAG: sigma-70 family RNA polymerase sigma factor [Phycisphaeraceae bacterium]
MSESPNNPSPATPPEISSESERRKHFALCWIQAQPVVAAYIASGIRDRQHCEDVIQETALSIAEAFDQYEPAKPFLPWAMGVARHKLLQYYRKHNRDKLVFDPELLSQIGARIEAQADDAKGRQLALSHCLDKLAEHAREMIKLRYVGNLGYEQIAERVNRTAAGVANSLYRSRKALADCIKLETKRNAGDDA